jgi:hypothetical protein
MRPVNLGRLRRDGHLLYTREAAAVLHEVCRAMVVAQAAGRVPVVPSPDELWVTPEGALQIDSAQEHGDPRTVMPALGALVEALLPPFSQEPDYAVPMSFRLLAPRARGKPGLPELASVAALRAEVARFEAGPPAEVLRALPVRVTDRAPAATDTPLEDVGPAVMVPLPRPQVTDTEPPRPSRGPRSAAGERARARSAVAAGRAPAPDPLSEDPAGEIPLLPSPAPPDPQPVLPVRITLAKPDHSPPVPAGGLPRASAPAQGGRAGLIVAVLVALVLGALLGAVATASYMRDRGPVAERWPAALGGSPAAVPGEVTENGAVAGPAAEESRLIASPAAAGVDVSRTSGRAPAATGTTGAAEEPAGTRGTAERPADARAPRPLALPGVRGPVYSPSFAADGAVLLFHAGRDESRLMRADLSGSGSPVRVEPLMGGPSRDYHPRLSPDGELVAFDSDRDGERGVYVARRDGSEARRISGPGFGAVPTWSPDMRRLAFVRAEPRRSTVWNLWLYTLATGELTRVTSHRVGQMWGASWFPDGQRLCYSHEDRLVVHDLSTGREQTFPSPIRRRLVRTPAVSPDGTRIVFQLRRDGVWLLHLADGSSRRLLQDPTAEEFAWHPDGDRVAYHSSKDGEWRIWVVPAPG